MLNPKLKPKFTLYSLLFTLLLSSCCTTHIATSSTDSLTVRHYEAERKILRDTIIDIALPVENIEVYIAPPCSTEPTDSISIIETSLAISEVRLNRDGSTSHSLRNKADTLHIEATLHDKETILRDSIFTKHPSGIVNLFCEITPKWNCFANEMISGFM